MSDFLFDTMVVSVGFNPARHPEVAHWLAGDDIVGWLSVVTLGEIRRGIVAAKQPALAQRLEPWFAGLLIDQAGQFLPVSAEIATCWGELTARLGRSDLDLLIAATALVHDLTLVTRNVRHFANTGVRLHNPWPAQP